MLHIGTKNSKLKIYVFSDLFCPSCLEWYAVEQELLKRYKKKLLFIHYFFPLDTACNYIIPDGNFHGSCTITNLMFDAYRYGFFEDAFYVYIDLAKKYDPKTKYPKINKYLTEYISNTKKNKSLRIKDGNRTILEDHIKAAKAISLTATPTIIINGRKMEGVIKFNEMSDIIKQAIQK